jgi:hypothetical protein
VVVLIVGPALTVWSCVVLRHRAFFDRVHQALRTLDHGNPRSAPPPDNMPPTLVVPLVAGPQALMGVAMTATGLAEFLR